MHQFKVEKGFLVTKLYLPYKNQNKFEPLPVILDTGALVTVIDPSFTDFLGYSIKDAFSLSNLDGAAGVSKGYSINFKNVKCFNHDLQNIVIACHDLNSKLGIKGLLGMNILNHFRIDLAYNTGEVFAINKIH